MKNKELIILLSAPRGFCAGVERAIEIVEKSIQKFGAPVYVRHEIVHNKHVVDDLKNNELNCYSNPGGNWNLQEIIKISPLKFQIKLEEDFLSGRGKLNCTSKIDDKWHWRGYQFLVK